MFLDLQHIELNKLLVLNSRKILILRKESRAKTHSLNCPTKNSSSERILAHDYVKYDNWDLKRR